MRVFFKRESFGSVCTSNARTTKKGERETGEVPERGRNEGALSFVRHCWLRWGGKALFRTEEEEEEEEEEEPSSYPIEP